MSRPITSDSLKIITYGIKVTFWLSRFTDMLKIIYFF